jgi:peptide/nickel transport system substrate-binding protein
MVKHLRIAITLTLVFSALLIFAACGGSSSSDTATTATTTEPQAPQQPAQPVAATAPDAPTRPSTLAPLVAPTAAAPTGGESMMQMPGPAAVKRLVMAMTAPTEETNAGNRMGGTAAWQLGPMYEWTASVDPETGAYTPMLAEGWTISEKAIKFRFREGVQFHSGWGDLTAHDFAQSIADALHEDNTNAQYKANVAGVEVLNDREAQVNLKRINVTLFRNISQFVGGFEVMSVKNFREAGGYPGLDDQPIAGTGPYQFVERAEGSYVRFKRVPYEHWRVTPEFEELELRFIGEESTRLAALLTGEIHISPLATDLHETAFSKGMSSVKGTIPAKRVLFGFLCCFLQDRTMPELGYVYPDAPMADIRMRRALSKAIDRDVINQALFNGGADNMVVQGYNPRSDGWNPEWPAQYEEHFAYDPDGARALLADVGYGPNNPYEMGMILLSSYRGLPEGQDVVLAVVDMLQDVGIKVNIESMDSSTQGSRARNLEFDNHLNLRSTSSDLFTNAFIYGSQWSRTPSNFVTPRLNELHLAARATMNQSEHTKIFREVGDLFVSLNQSIPLLWVPTVVLYNPDVVSDWQFPGSMIALYSHFDGVRAAR